MLVTNSSNMQCEYCTEVHKLCFCKLFAKQSTESRREFVTKHRICFNCLGSNHIIRDIIRDCKKQTSCRVCKKRHHSLLHLNRESNVEFRGQEATLKPAVPNTSFSTSNGRIVPSLSTDHSDQPSKPRKVLLTTALVKAESKALKRVSSQKPQYNILGLGKYQSEA
ncbi:hypothetical protein PYW08_006254 [Mythimna loreyi]|uniref:Uncharacterized protein n=1 Tax=Mythimna loreyi TaxID=667449 RepID=A0ACC2QM65_9NEOP|nr:hypothetical protein PYW08_006254 [Mythimna loreyi]